MAFHLPFCDPRFIFRWLVVVARRLVSATLPHGRKPILTDLLIDLLPLLMFLSLMALMFTGYPIGLVLGGLAVAYGALGIALDIFSFAEFFIFVPRVWLFAENLQLIAVPLLIFMGVMFIQMLTDSVILVAPMNGNVVRNTVFIISLFSK